MLVSGETDLAVVVTVVVVFVVVVAIFVVSKQQELISYEVVCSYCRKKLEGLVLGSGGPLIFLSR